MTSALRIQYPELTVQYAYDAAGNRTTMTTTTEGTTTYQYDDANRLVLSLSKGLTSVDGVDYTWDDRDNLIDDGTFTYTHSTCSKCWW